MEPTFAALLLTASLSTGQSVEEAAQNIKSEPITLKEKKESVEKKHMKTPPSKHQSKKTKTPCHQPRQGKKN